VDSVEESALKRGNIFASLPVDRDAEHIDALLEGGEGRVERIVSFGQASPDGFWYDQEQSEWVLVLRGGAKLEVEGLPGLIELTPGDYLNLSAHTRHRVAWTTPEEATIWLAIYY
jgi:cupin 2 domain-containing protein